MPPCVQAYQPPMPGALSPNAPVLSEKMYWIWPSSSFRLDVRASAGVSVAASYMSRSPLMNFTAWCEGQGWTQGQRDSGFTSLPGACEHEFTTRTEV